MSYQVIIEAEAEENLKEAALWLAQYSSHKAEPWYFEMLDKIDSLAEMPLRCPLAPRTLFSPRRFATCSLNNTASFTQSGRQWFTSFTSATRPGCRQDQ